MVQAPIAARAAGTATASTPLGPVVASFVAALAFGVEGVLALTHGTWDEHWDALSQLLNASYAVGSIAIIFALPSVARRLQGRGRVGVVGAVMAQLGYAGMTAETIISGINRGSTLGFVFFAGLLLCLAGLLVLGVAGLIDGRRRWAAALPFLGMLVGIGGGDHGGALVLAGVWVLLGVNLHRSGDDAV